MSLSILGKGLHKKKGRGGMAAMLKKKKMKKKLEGDMGDRDPEQIPMRGIYMVSNLIDDENYEKIKKFDDLNLEEYLSSPFQEIEDLNTTECERLEKDCKVKFIGDDSMMTHKQYDGIFEKDFHQDSSLITRKFK